MNWWVVVTAFLAPWLRILLNPSVSIKKAGSWGIWMLGAGMIGAVVSIGAARVIVARGAPRSDVAWLQTPALASVALTLSGLLIFGLAAWQAEAAGRYQRSAR